MSEPAAITSAHAPDVEDVRQWMEKMIKAMKLVELAAAVIALITRLRDVNNELTKRLADLRRSDLARRPSGGSRINSPLRSP